jgi:hypothetical protein
MASEMLFFVSAAYSPSAAYKHCAKAVVSAAQRSGVS